MAGEVSAQIPNSGFEDWTDVGNYQEPNGWATMNGLSGTSFNSCSRSTDHYPSNIGQYSIRLENNIALTQLTGGYGGVVTGAFNFPFQPAFPLVGNPSSLHGHFKFTSISGDQAWIKLVLFNEGVIVADENYVSEAQSYPNWTPFDILLDNYGDADSATILIFAFYPIGQTDGPNGNSILWVDNLSFDSPITSVTEPRGIGQDFSIYPNPAVGMFTVETNSTIAQGSTIGIYSMLGTLVHSEQLLSNRQVIDATSLISGAYLIEVRSADAVSTRKLLVQH